MAAIRKMVINILKNYKQTAKIKRSIQGIGKVMSCSEQTMVDILDTRALCAGISTH